MAAAQYGLPLLVVVFNNKKYLSMRFNLTRGVPGGRVRREQERLRRRPVGAAGRGRRGRRRAARPGFTVTTTPELGPALEKAIATVRAGQTAVVNVHLTR